MVRAMTTNVYREITLEGARRIICSVDPDGITTTGRLEQLRKELNVKLRFAMKVYAVHDAPARGQAWRDLKKISAHCHRISSYFAGDRQEHLRGHLDGLASQYARENEGFGDFIDEEPMTLFNVNPDSGVESPITEYGHRMAVKRALQGIELLDSWCRLADAIPGPERHEIGPRQRLIGVILPYTFEKLFNQRYTTRATQTKSAVIQTVGVRFVCSVLEEAGLKTDSAMAYSPDTVATYFKQVKAMKRRRGDKKPKK